ncbi:hypothetical protein BKA93DRAFT_792937 [Sparassis latifolia]
MVHTGEDVPPPPARFRPDTRLLSNTYGVMMLLRSMKSLGSNGVGQESRTLGRRASAAFSSHPGSRLKYHPGSVDQHQLELFLPRSQG